MVQGAYLVGWQVRYRQLSRQTDRKQKRRANEKVDRKIGSVFTTLVGNTDIPGIADPDRVLPNISYLNKFHLIVLDLVVVQHGET